MKKLLLALGLRWLLPKAESKLNAVTAGDESSVKNLNMQLAIPGTVDVQPHQELLRIMSVHGIPATEVYHIVACDERGLEETRESLGYVYRDGGTRGSDVVQLYEGLRPLSQDEALYFLLIRRAGVGPQVLACVDRKTRGVARSLDAAGLQPEAAA